MNQATLIRQSTGDEGTFGAILFGGGFALHTLELPWENNEPNVSCIPCGMYTCIVKESHRFGSSYHVTDVQGRTHIIFHRGNWAGRRSMPELHSNVLGCILLGHDRGIIEGQKAVLTSAKAIDDMHGYLKGEPFELLVMSRIDGISFTTNAV